MHGVASGACASGNMRSGERTANHQGRVRGESGGSEATGAVDRCVHELVEERCRAQPDAPAVCAWDGDLTYAELNAHSSALAAHLVERGVGPEVFVPLCFEKSRWTTVAMLGVMKAGGTFVLLDPSHPRTRLRGICQIVSAPLVVSSAAKRALAAELAAAVVVVGDGERAWRQACGPWAGSSVVPNNALYAVFTSGSTGAPKGTVILHTAFATSAFAHSQAFSLTSESRFLQFASYAFDASIIDGLTTLLIGGCICVPSDTERLGDITATANKLQISITHLTASAARLLRAGDITSLQTLVLGGEPVTSRDIDQWSSEVDLVNVYGPAECSVTATVQININTMSDPRNIGHGIGCVTWVVDNPNQEYMHGDDEQDESDEDTKADNIFAVPTDDVRAAILVAETALHDAVPAYVVPAVFLPLVAVPLAATGKTDRRRLRERAATLTRAEIQAYCSPTMVKAAPTTAAERSLQQLWAQVLQIAPDSIGADDSFFRLGGDSISAMHLASLTRSQGLELSVSHIFALRKLSTLAAVIVKSQNGEMITNVEPFSLLEPQQKSYTQGRAVYLLPTTQSLIFCLSQIRKSSF